MLAHRVRRRLRWALSGNAWAADREPIGLPHSWMAHRSPLLRRLGQAELRLQHNKVTNLRLAAGRVDGLLIRPGETFSFNRVVGSCTRRRGYLEGLLLADGATTSGVGGGICQLANLLHWLVLHSPLTVVERSEHSFDAFPDEGRVVPWGVGCTIVYNYVDLVVRNDTATTFQLRTWVEEPDLRGELLADRPAELAYRVQARDELFFRRDDAVYRRNELWRTTTSTGGELVAEELFSRNLALVRYDLDPAQIREVA